MKKTPLALLTAAVLSLGSLSAVVAEQVEQVMKLDVKIENDNGPFVVAELNGEKHEVQLSKEAMTDKDVLRAEISHLPQELQDKMVNMFDHHGSGVDVIVETDGDHKKVIKKIIKIDGDSDIANVWHSDSGKKIVIESSSDGESLHFGPDGDSKVFVFKTEFEGDGDFSMADVIVSMIKKQDLTEEEKQKIRDALND